MDIYVSYTCLKITSVFHITLSWFFSFFFIWKWLNSVYIVNAVSWTNVFTMIQCAFFYCIVSGHLSHNILRFFPFCVSSEQQWRIYLKYLLIFYSDKSYVEIYHIVIIKYSKRGTLLKENRQFENKNKCITAWKWIIKGISHNCSWNFHNEKNTSLNLIMISWKLMKRCKHSSSSYCFLRKDTN